MPSTPSSSSVALIAQVQALQDKINNLSGSASAQDVVYLAKAVETIGGHATILDVINSGTDQIALVNQAGTAKVAAVNQAGADQLAAIAAQLATVNTTGANQVAAVNAAVLGGTSTLIDLPSDASATQLASTLKGRVSVRAPKGLALRTAILKLPDATAVSLPFNAVEILNTSWAVLRLQTSAGADLGYVGPKGRAVFYTSQRAANDWRAGVYASPWIDPDVEVFTYNNGTTGYYHLPQAWYHPTAANSYNAQVSVPSGSYSGTYGFNDTATYAGAVLSTNGELIASAYFGKGSNGTYQTLGFRHKWLPNGAPESWPTLTINNTYNYPAQAFAASLTPSYTACSSGWRNLAVAATYLAATGYVVLFSADYSAAPTVTLGAVAVAGSAATANLQLLPFGNDDRTVGLIVPTATGRTLYRYQIDANGQITAKGSASFSASALFCKLSPNRIFIKDGGASGVYAMDDAAATISLKTTTPSATYNAVGTGSVSMVGSYLEPGVAQLGTATLVLESDDSLTVTASSFSALSDNCLHLRDGVFMDAACTNLYWIDRAGSLKTTSLSADSYYNRAASLTLGKLHAPYAGGVIGTLTSGSNTVYSGGQYSFGFGIDALKGGQ